MNTAAYQTFWQAVATKLAAGSPLDDALAAAQAAVAGTDVAPEAAAVVRAVKAGGALSSALQRAPEAHPRAVREMVLAGEHGGVLDRAAQRIAQGLAEGSIHLSDTPGSGGPAEDLARFWSSLGLMLSAGVRLLTALEAQEEMFGGRLRAAVAALRRSVIEGQGLAQGMRAFADLFADSACQAIASAEASGTLDVRALELGEQLRRSAAPAIAAGSDEEESTAQLANQVLLRAIQERASDLHLDATADGEGRARIRVDGVLRPLPLPPRAHPALLSRLKSMAAMDVAERKLPQDGRIMLKVNEQMVDLRCSTVPAAWGERMTLRILRWDVDVPQLPALVAPEDLEVFRRLCRLPSGMVVANGPTGCGKTSLLYAMLMEMDREQACVLSVEDPVELNLPGVAQMQIKPQIGLTFPRLLRSVLRQDPDVILVGEIRDPETLQVVCQAAVTGHLVLTTLHATTSPGALRRMLDIGQAPFVINATLAAIISLRLVRKLCPECRQPVRPDVAALPPEARPVARDSRSTFFAARGCARCGQSGYMGRMALHEILLMDDRTRQATSANATTGGLRAAALESGMKPMLVDGLEKAARGLTSIEEVLQSVPSGGLE